MQVIGAADTDKEIKILKNLKCTMSEMRWVKSAQPNFMITNLVIFNTCMYLI
jgi:hypothetical protein